MSQVIFPSINLKLNISRVVINIFGIDIYWYAILIVLPFTIGIILCKKDDKKYNIKFEDILEVLIIVIPISILCARLYFVIFKLDYYLKFPQEILNFRDGGLAIYGGIIGTVITIIIYCKVKKINILDMLDYIVPYLPLGQAIGRWGNFFNIEAYGIETNNIFRMGIIENGQYIEVHPTFLYESICCLIIFFILYVLRYKRKYKGLMICIYLALYSLERTIIEGLRTDSLMLGNIRISQLLSIILCIICSIILIYKEIKGKKENEK